MYVGGFVNIVIGVATFSSMSQHCRRCHNSITDAATLSSLGRVIKDGVAYAVVAVRMATVIKLSSQYAVCVCGYKNILVVDHGIGFRMRLCVAMCTHMLVLLPQTLTIYLPT